MLAGVAQLAVFKQAPPAEESAKFEKAPQSKFLAAPRLKNFGNCKSHAVRLTKILKNYYI